MNNISIEEIEQKIAAGEEVIDRIAGYWLGSGIIIGNLEMDFADGEISYKTSIDVAGEELTALMTIR